MDMSKLLLASKSDEVKFWKEEIETHLKFVQTELNKLSSLAPRAIESLFNDIHLGISLHQSTVESRIKLAETKKLEAQKKKQNQPPKPPETNTTTTTKIHLL